MKFDEFTHMYSLSKTLRFKLIPVGATVENIDKKGLLLDDKKKAEEYKDVKALADSYHKFFIERVLSASCFSNDTIVNLAALYYNRKKDSDALKKYNDYKADLCKSVSQLFKNDKEYKAINSKELITKILPKFVKNETDNEKIADFAKFTLYFDKYFQNRENMYSEEEKSTSIANRIVNDNLPKFFDNAKNGHRILESLPATDIDAINREFKYIYNITVQDILTLDYGNKVFSQAQIETYNNIIGGYSNSDGSKIQGLNEVINQYNQTHNDKIPKLRMLFKQILSDRDSISFIPDDFVSDDEVINSIIEYYANASDAINQSVKCFDSINLSGVYVNKKYLSAFSQELTGDWSFFKYCMKDESKKDIYNVEAFQKYVDGRENAADYPINVLDSIKVTVAELSDAITNAYNVFKDTITVPYVSGIKLSKNEEHIVVIKNLLDSIKNYQDYLSRFYVDCEGEDCDSVFYGEFYNVYEKIQLVVPLYNKVRNYISKKPYSTEKYILNFNRSDFLNGWAQPDEYNFSEAHLLMKDNDYLLFILNDSLKLKDVSELYTIKDDEETAQHFDYYFQKPDNKNTPRLFIRSKGTAYAPAVEKYNLPIESIIEAYDKGWFKTEYAKKDPVLFKKSLSGLIDYYKIGFSKHESYKCFDFNWKPTEEYNNISEFYRDTITSCYKIDSKEINYTSILKLVESGKGYLFRIYSKDFSMYSKGTPNMHTLYFKMLFDTRNTESKVFKLSGGAEMFYRPKSLSLTDTAVHLAQTPLKNKSTNAEKKTSTFGYDLVKDKRFTDNQFEIHIPIEINFKDGKDSFINEKVRDSIRKNGCDYVIGIDRGERNLIYVSVVDKSGKVIEQLSLNTIINEYGGQKHSTDYHTLLDYKEKERLDARRNWQAITSIKDLKEGYLSQVVNIICKLAIKYNAIIVMENLNVGFKNVRSGVEKSVYQKFETMLVNKLSFLADKKKNPAEPGGILNAYQLALPTTSYNDLHGQNGIVFYIPAWMTSKIDPKTGFCDLLRPKYQSIQDSVDFIRKFKAIGYSETEKIFFFDFSYEDFGTKIDFKRKWRIYSYGERIYTHRDLTKANAFVSERKNLTEEFANLFERYGINYHSENLLDEITDKSTLPKQDAKDFYSSLLFLLSLTLQLRNSISKSTNPEDDYIISPVKTEKDEVFFDSRDFSAGEPCDADANGAYNIAREGLILINRIVDSRDGDKVDLKITREQWLEYAQTQDY